MLNLLRIDRKILRELIAIAVPMVISQGAYAVMIFTDRYFMSLISPTHMAASLGGGVASFCCLSLFIGVLSYGNALIAQYYGAGALEKCPRVVSQGLILAVLSTPALLITAWLVGDLFAAMGHEPQQAALERQYFYILMWGASAALVKVCIASYFAGIGRTKTVMIADTLGVIFNVALSYILIFGKLGLPEMGIVGAGLGTVISNLLTLLIYSGFYFKREHRERFRVLHSFAVDRGIIKRYMRLGFPSGLEHFLNIAAFNLFLLMFQSYGVAQAASAAIVFNWDMVSFVPLTGLHIALVSTIGRYVGAGNMEKVNQVIASGFLIGLGYSSILAVVFIIFKVPLVELFIMPGVHYQEIRELSSYMMIGLASYVMADALILVSGGVLRGAGDTKWLMKTSVLLHWAMLVAQVIVIKLLDFGPRTSWMIFVCLILSIAAIFVLRLHGKKWRSREALSQVMAEH